MRLQVHRDAGRVAVWAVEGEAGEIGDAQRVDAVDVRGERAAGVAQAGAVGQVADGDGVGGVGIALEMRGDGQRDRAVLIDAGRRGGVRRGEHRRVGDRGDVDGDGLDGRVGRGGALGGMRFYLMLRAPPGATRFPYATLFRSGDAQRVDAVDVRGERAAGVAQAGAVGQVADGDGVG